MPRGDNLRATMGHHMPEQPYYEANTAELAFDLFIVAMAIGLFMAGVLFIVHSVQTILAPATPAPQPPAPMPELAVTAPDMTPPPPASPSSDFVIPIGTAG